VNQSVADVLRMADSLGQLRQWVDAYFIGDPMTPKTTEGLSANLAGWSTTVAGMTVQLSNTVNAQADASQLTFQLTLDASRQVNAALDLGSAAAAEGLQLAGTAPTVPLTAQLHAGFTFGLDLTDGTPDSNDFFVRFNVAEGRDELSLTLSIAQGVVQTATGAAPANGQLADDLTFQLAVNGDDAGAASITVSRSATLDNLTSDDLVADLNAAGLPTGVVAGWNGTALTFTATGNITALTVYDAGPLGFSGGLQDSGPLAADLTLGLLDLTATGAAVTLQAKANLTVADPTPTPANPASDRRLSFADLATPVDQFVAVSVTGQANLGLPITIPDLTLPGRQQVTLTATDNAILAGTTTVVANADFTAIQMRADSAREALKAGLDGLASFGDRLDMADQLGQKVAARLARGLQLGQRGPGCRHGDLDVRT
jgi:hypothetical protein